MKKLFLLCSFALLAFAITLSSNLQAQDIKIGYTSAYLILPHVPEYTKAQDSLEKYQKALEVQLTEKQKELEAKAQKLDADAKSGDVPQVVLQSRYQDLQRMDQELRKERDLYARDLQARQAQLTNPILKQVKEAIEAVGKDNGYTFILSSQDGLGQDTFLYSTDAIDVSHLVLAKLGISMTPEQLKAAREKLEKEAEEAMNNANNN